ncbi:sensor histidine kinase, partial [Clostridium cochlearium]|uniref:sensor histidine kinase n=1 Tax=Clostridium cochlearium TaxID=1494 RepID=UPI001EDFCE5C
MSFLNFIEFHEDLYDRNDYFNSFYKNSILFKNIVDNTLDLNKLEFSYCSVNLSNIDIISSVKSVIDYFEDIICSKEIQLEFINDMDNFIVACDKEKLERIVFNLIYNSIKYTNKNDKIIVSTKEKDNKVYISVEDTGIGVPSNELRKIFN